MFSTINFELDIEQIENEQYRATAHWGDERAAVRFNFPFDDKELVRFMGRVGGLREAMPYPKDKPPLREQIETFGSELFEKIFTDTVLTLYERCIADANKNKKAKPVRICLNLQHADLAYVPWEFLFDPKRQCFLVESNDAPLIRYVSPLDSSKKVDNIGKSLNIVVLISSPSHSYLHQLDVDQEWENFNNDLAELEKRGLVNLIRVERLEGESDYAAVQRVLRKHECHIFHYIGHGDHNENAGGNLLVWENRDGSPHFVKDREVLTLFRDSSQLRLVVLNSCSGAKATSKDPFAGIAQQLAQEIPSVVAMQFKITDGAAIQFSREFYRALLKDARPILTAVTESRKAIIGDSNDIEWSTPVVYTHLRRPHFIDIFPPYKGLDSFGEEDARLFFGRDKLIGGKLVGIAKPEENGTLIKRIRTEWFDKKGEIWGRMLIITGASGSGKSSLVKAGLLPKFRREGWTIYDMTPDKDPLAELSSLIGLSSATDLFKSDRQTTAKSLGRTSPQGKPAILFVDQFEELFTLCKDEEERKAFIDNLVTAAQSPQSKLHIILTLRADCLGDCLRYDQLREAMQTQALLGPMGSHELREVIALPVEGKCNFEPGLVDRLIKDCQEGVDTEPGILPFLSYILSKLWDERDGQTLTQATYNKFGGVQGAITTTADDLYKQLGNNDSTESEAQKACRGILIRLVKPAPTDNSGLDTRQRVSRRELIDQTDDPSSIKEDVLQSLIDKRLLRSNRNDETGEEFIEVAHEALIRTWPKLKEWLRIDRDNLIALDKLNGAAEAWDKNGRKKEYLQLAGENPGRLQKRFEANQLPLGCEVRLSQDGEG